jgi:GAF domain-containing protein
LFGSRKKAIEWLELAAQLADQNRLIQESALAHELLGKIYMASGEHGAFQEHMLEARFRYHLWRAQAKVRLMEKLYRLRHERMDAPQAAEGTLSAASLDLQTVIKASQTLSSEVQLEGLFKRMVHIVLESAGATAGTILLREGNTWSQRATYSIANGQQNLDLTIVPFSEENAAKLALPVTVANYLIHTRKPLALSHPQQNPAYAKDSYLQRHDPKSILCLPFSSKGDDLGILYLENNLIADAFTEDRVRLLSMLTAQLAISVENAFLYETLEQKVQARTFDLSEKNRELEIEKKKSDRLFLNI